MKKILTMLAAVCAMVAFTGVSAMAAAPKVFKKCKACHTIKKGKHKIGPSLFGVYGRRAGTAKGFKKYKTLKGGKDYTWDDAKLDKLLTNAKAFFGKKTPMNIKLKKAEDRKAVIEYLKTLK